MDILSINILTTIGMLLLGYLLGSIPTGIVIGKAFFHKDPRDYGSHNSGGTNVGRLFGKRIGLLVIVLDMLKVLVPLYVSWAILTFVKFNGKTLCPSFYEFNRFGFATEPENFVFDWPIYWVVALGAVIGHCWPVFAKFRGGKGAAVNIGTAVGTSFCIGFVPGLLYLLVLKKTKFVSFCAIFFCILSTLLAWICTILVMTNIVDVKLSWIFMYGPTLNFNFFYAIVITFQSIVTIVRHKDNIKRLLAGNERKIKWMK